MPGCALTQGYNLDCKDSFGGVKKIYIMAWPDATAITEAAGVVTAITKAATKVFFVYSLVAHTAEGEENVTNNRDAGTSSNTQSVKFPINKMTVAVRNELLLLGKNRVLIAVEDENGTVWLYGKNYGLLLNQYSAKTGKVLLDRNGYELNFEGMEKELAPSVDATTVTSLLVAGT